MPVPVWCHFIVARGLRRQFPSQPPALQSGPPIPRCRFIESNPQGKHHSRLDPEQLPAFLDRAAEVLRNKSVGYGLWAYQAYRRNELHNGGFQQRLEGWGVDGCCGWPVDTDAENVRCPRCWHCWRCSWLEACIGARRHGRHFTLKPRSSLRILACMKWLAAAAAAPASQICNDDWGG
jgi:hypothetical protein